MPDSSPTACNCSAIRQAARHVTRLYDEALAPVGIGINQFAILARLARLGPMSVQDLAANLVMDRTTLSHLLKPLEARGVIATAAAAEDRRRKRVTLTPAGLALVERARPLWAEAQRRYEAAVGSDEAAALRRSLDGVATTRFEGVSR